MTTWYCWLEFDFGGVNFLVGEPGPGEQGVPCCLDDQGDNRVHDVDHNCCMDDQDNPREQHDDVDHNPVKGQGEQGVPCCLDDRDDYREHGIDNNHDADQCCLDDQDNYREYGVDHIHDPDQWNQINTWIACCQ